jgi:hypothetical protein
MDWETTHQRVEERLAFKLNQIIAGRWLNGFPISGYAAMIRRPPISQRISIPAGTKVDSRN